MNAKIIRILAIYSIIVSCLFCTINILDELRQFPWWIAPRSLTAASGIGVLAGFIALIGAVLWSNRTYHPIGPICLGLVVVALPPSQLLAWDTAGAYAEFCWNLSVSAWTIACGGAAIGLLSFLRIPLRTRWLRIATILSVFMLLVIIMFIVWGRNLWGYHKSGTIMLVALNLTGVSIGAQFILHLLATSKRSELVTTSDTYVNLQCPRCHKQVALGIGRTACSECGLFISIEIEEEKCKRCGYPMFGLPSGRCPECGTRIA